MKEDLPTADEALKLYDWFRSPCPFYKNGICTAPSLCKPSDVYTVPSRCLSIQHKTCAIYIAAKEGRMFEKCYSSVHRRRGPGSTNYLYILY